MKIEGLLNEDGIQLSQTSPDHIKGILDKAGPRLGCKPDWPQQELMKGNGMSFRPYKIW